MACQLLIVFSWLILTLYRSNCQNTDSLNAEAGEDSLSLMQQVEELKSKNAILRYNMDKLTRHCGHGHICQVDGRIYLQGEQWLSNCSVCTCHDRGDVNCQPDQSRSDCFNICSNNPCANDGICVTTDDDTFKCTCANSYYGRRCESRINSCKDTAEYGICLGNHKRWFYNQTASECQTFIYSGCGGSLNTFHTMSECVNSCEKGACCYLESGLDTACEIRNVATCKGDQRTRVIAFHVGWPGRNVWRTDYHSCNLGIETFPIGVNLTRRGCQCNCAEGGHFKCSSRPTIRKEYRALTHQEWKDFAKSVQTSRLTGTGNEWEGLKDAYDAHYQDATSEDNYLLWNRMFLKYAELLLGNIPYWDFTVDELNFKSSTLWSSFKLGRPRANDGYCVQRHAFQNGTDQWSPCIRRRPDWTLTGPSRTDVIVALSEKTFQGFTREVRKIVVKLCRVIGVDDPPYGTPYDPLFYLIHCYVDMLFAKWQDRHKATFESAQSATRVLYPFKDVTEQIWYLNNYQVGLSYSLSKTDSDWYDIIDPCLPNPCENGGTCGKTQSSKSQFTCKCLEEFEGPLCEHAATLRCYQPVDARNGTCGPTERWYFEWLRGSCVKFNYTGCHPVGNNFASLYDCRVNCIVGACCWTTPLNPGRVDGFNADGYDKYGHYLGNDSQTDSTPPNDVRQCLGYDDKGFNNVTGFNLTGYNEIGDHDGLIDFDEDGYDDNGYDRDGYNCHGVNVQGWDRCGFSTGHLKECRAMIMSECKRVEEQHPHLKRRVTQFATGLRCEDIECANSCTCQYLNETYVPGQVFQIGVTSCACHGGGWVRCDFKATTRKDIRDLSNEEWVQYQNALSHLRVGHFPSKWRQFTTLYSRFLSQSRGVTFLAWHRTLLKVIESELRSYHPNVTIPYYDWTLDTDPTTSLIWQANALGGNGNPSKGHCVDYTPFVSGQANCLRRNFSGIPLPDKVYLELQLRLDSYQDFVLQMEQVSGLLHKFVGGHMATPYCLEDPVFLSVYAFIDKLGIDWNNRRETQFPPELKYVSLHPFGVTPDQDLKVKYLTTEDCECIVNESRAKVPQDRGYQDGYDSMGWDYNGFNRLGYNRDGYDASGYDGKGYNRYGATRDGCVKEVVCNGTRWNHTSYDQYGFDAEGLDLEGYDQYGFDIEGFDRRGCNYSYQGPFYPKIMLEYEEELKTMSFEELTRMDHVATDHLEEWFVNAMWGNQSLLELRRDKELRQTREFQVDTQVDYWIPTKFKGESMTQYCSSRLCYDKTCPFNNDVYCRVRNDGNCSVVFIHKLTGVTIPCPDNYCQYLGNYYLNGVVVTNQDGNATCQRCFCKEGVMDCWPVEHCPRSCTHGFDSNVSCCSTCTDCSYLDYLLVDGQLFATPDNPCKLCTCSEGNVTCTDVRAACPRLTCGQTEVLKGDCCPVCEGCHHPTTNAYQYHGTQWQDPEDSCKTCSCVEGTVKCHKWTCPKTCRNPLTFDCCPDCSGCYYKGITYSNGSTVNDSDACKNCSCVDGNVVCDTIQCPELNCPKATTVPGKCCSVCQNCEFHGMEYADSEEFVDKTNPCLTCQCAKGLVQCFSTKSSCKNNCSHPVSIPGQCCTACNQGCQIGSKMLEDNSTFLPNEDPCFTCNCTAGNVTCNNVTCPETNCLTSVKRLGQCCPICTCQVGKAVYREGQKWNSTQYKCEECVCLNSRPYCYRLECPSVDCSNPAAPHGVCCPECNHCEYKRRLYRNGQEFIYTDGPCRKCLCKNGTVTCQEEICPPIQCTHPLRLPDECCPLCNQGCLLEGKLLKHAEKFQHPMEKCVDCKCNGGNVTCAQRKCGTVKCLHPAMENCCPVCKDCEYQGELIRNAERVLVEDECTICTCDEGTVVCRAKKCPPYNCKTPILRNCCPICVEGCYHNGHAYHLGQEFETPDKPCETCVCLEEKKKLPLKNKGTGNFMNNWIDFQEGQVHCHQKPCEPVTCEDPKLGKCCPMCTGTCLLGSLEMQNGTSIKDPENTCNTCACVDGKLDCTTEICPVVACGVTVKNSGDCCETCKGCLYESQVYDSGSSWTSVADPCLSCQCNEGIVTCAQLHCVVPCINPVSVPGQCCPICPGCTVGSLTYKSGDTFHPNENPCEICTCESGQLICLSQHCPPLVGCPKESIKPPRVGECCPTCSGLSSACHENDIEILKYPTDDPCFACECKVRL